MDYTNLFTMSEYSFLESVISNKQLIAFHKKHNYKYVGLAEKEIMYSAPEFLKQALTNNLVPVLSINFTIYDSFNHESSVLLVALNYAGYKNLMQISTSLNQYSKPKILIKNILPFLNHKNNALVVKNESFFLKHQNDATLIYYGASAKLVNNHIKRSVPWHQATFLYQNQQIVYRAISAIKNNQHLVDISEDCDQLQFRNHRDVQLLHSPNTLKNLVLLLQMIDFKIPKIKINFLKFSKTKKDLDIFLKAAHVGLEWRIKNNNYIKNNVQKYWDRLQYEIKIITTLGWESYFLLVWDVIRFAKMQKIAVGPGRGSASGSLVVYALGITDVDPLKYNLIFERFLNPERVSMPDIDIDFQDNRRQEIINYVFEKYGDDHVAHIVTFQTIGAKTAIRDSGRILEIDINIINKISKMLTSPLNLLANYHQSVLLRAQINMSPELKMMFRIACQLEGSPRQSGLHAAGLVFNSEILSNFCPMKKISKNLNVTQFSMDYLEDYGLVKVDFLGLRALTTLSDINSSGPNINLSKITLNNAKVFALMNRGDTSGIFQLESFGMRKVLTRIHITSFEDIVSAISLYRPGPQDNIEIYADRKLKVKTINYLDIRLKPILEYTYGIIIYQEQIIQLAQLVANFSLAKADLLRRAMSKKDISIMEKLKDEFISNALLNNYSQVISEQIYALIYKFANYGFNRAHAVAYASIAYQLAYFKSNYYLYFITNLLNNFINNKIKLKEMMTEAQSKKIIILGLDINKSGLLFSEEGGEIRLPLIIIKGVGKMLLTKLITERNKKPFINFFDFIARMYLLGFNENTFLNFVYSGSLDCFANRSSLLNSLDNAMNYVKLFNKNNLKQTKLLQNNIISAPLLQMIDDDIELLTLYEKKVLGFNWKMHPTKPFTEKYKNYVDLAIQIKQNKKQLRGIFEINEIKVINTKQNEAMCFIIVSDISHSYELVVFPKKYKQLRQILKLNLIFEATLRRDDQFNEHRLILLSLNKVY